MAVLMQLLPLIAKQTKLRHFCTIIHSYFSHMKELINKTKTFKTLRKMHKNRQILSINRKTSNEKQDLFCQKMPQIKVEQLPNQIQFSRQSSLKKTQLIIQNLQVKRSKKVKNKSRQNQLHKVQFQSKSKGNKRGTAFKNLDREQYPLSK